MRKRFAFYIAAVIVLTACSAGSPTMGPARNGAAAPSAARAASAVFQPPSPEAMLAQVFPGHTFTADGTGGPDGRPQFRDETGRTFAIDSRVPGSFTGDNAVETLLIVSRAAHETSHVGGLYNAWAAIFDGDGRRLVSDVLPLAADEPHLALFEGKGRDFLFFAGPTTYNGWAEWDGGLWAADPTCHQLWPLDSGFWDNRAVAVLTGEEAGSQQADLQKGVLPHGIGLQVLERRVLPNPEQRVIPPYEFASAYRLLWDPVQADFKRE